MAEQGRDIDLRALWRFPAIKEHGYDRELRFYGRFADCRHRGISHFINHSVQPYSTTAEGRCQETCSHCKRQPDSRLLSYNADLCSPAFCQPVFCAQPQSVGQQSVWQQLTAVSPRGYRLRCAILEDQDCSCNCETKYKIMCSTIFYGSIVHTRLHNSVSTFMLAWRVGPTPVKYLHSCSSILNCD